MPLGYVTQWNHLIYTRHNLSHYFIILAFEIHDLLLERKKILKCALGTSPTMFITIFQTSQIQEIGANSRTDQWKSTQRKQQQNGTWNIRGHRSMILMTTEIQISFQDWEKQSRVISFVYDIKTKQWNKISKWKIVVSNIPISRWRGILAIERMGLFGKNIYFTPGNHSDDILTDLISTIEGTSNSCWSRTGMVKKNLTWCWYPLAWESSVERTVNINTNLGFSFVQFSCGWT